MLNAFRHQRFNTDFAAGLQETITCAQRLSASEIQHAGRIDGASGILKCSTPFGIRDSTPIARCQKVEFTNVLNAFRHQRFNTATAKTLVGFVTEANLASTS